jgi:hypothetical protein
MKSSVGIIQLDDFFVFEIRGNIRIEFMMRLKNMLFYKLLSILKTFIVHPRKLI